VSAPNHVVTQFVAAARRHHSDAKLLIRAEKYATADHLAGFAAECSIKAILVRYMGATAAPGTRPYSLHQNQKIAHGHLPKLWNELALLAQGRSGVQLAALTAGRNPFATWSVNDRYLDGTAITSTHAREHLVAAATIMRAYQLATFSGSLP
jgi:AbiV family abortive infection protein